MIYAIIATDTHERERALETLFNLGTATAHIYSEQIASLEPLVSATSLFGERVIVNLMQVMEVAISRDELIRLLPEMKTSMNIFIIDELFSDAHDIARLSKYAEKVFDAREEKERIDIFTLCNFFAKKDKKGAWREWIKIRDLAEPEAVSGLLWWKFQLVWGDVKSGRPSRFTPQECEKLGERIVLAPIKAHNGELDLKTELESIIVSL